MSLFASAITFDRKAIKHLKLNDPYAVHKAVYSRFEDIRSEEDKNKSQPSGIIYADLGSDCDGRKVVILSNRMPIIIDETLNGVLRHNPVPASFLDYDRYRFKIIINPTQRDNKSRVLIPIKGRAEIAVWFAHKALSQWGFQVIEQTLIVDKVEVQQFKDKNNHPVTLAQAHICGDLRVQDKELFNQSFSRGIGRGRAFGCGLLQISPSLDLFMSDKE